jgi:4-amino-4-deoxy-L-arabinose transferase-like glycosyltransferase
MDQFQSTSQGFTKFRAARYVHLLNALLWLAPLAIAGAIYLLITRHGIGLSPDSIAYYGAAENLKNGLGLSLPYGLPPNQPLTQFPPLLPLVLVLISKTGIPLILAARYLNLSLLACFVFLTNLILNKMDQQSGFLRSSLLRFALLLFISVFVAVQILFNMLWSEPLMILLGTSGFVVFFYAHRDERLIYSIISGILFGLTVATRYAGIAYLATALLFVLLDPKFLWKNKIINWVALSLPTLVFLYFWATRDIGNAVSSTGRTISFHSIDISHVHQIISTVGQWFQLPDSSQTFVKLFVTLLFGGFILYTTWQVWFSKKLKANFFEKIFTLFIYLYFLFILASLMFLDANIPLDTRILSPILFSVLILIITIKKFSTAKKEHVRFTGSFTVTVSILAFVVFLLNLPYVKSAYRNGIGFNSLVWKNYPSLQYFKDIQPPFLLISNAPEPVFYYTSHPVFSLPKQYLAMQEEQNAQYEEQIQQLISSYLNEKTYFIFFHDIKGGSQSDIAALQARFNFVEEAIFEEATIFSYAPRN